MNKCILPWRKQASKYDSTGDSFIKSAVISRFFLPVTTANLWYHVRKKDYWIKKNRGHLNRDFDPSQGQLAYRRGTVESGRAMCKLVSRIKRGLSTYFWLRGCVPEEERRDCGWLFIAAGRFCHVTNLETHFVIFASLAAAYYQIPTVSSYILRVETDQDAEDTFGRRPGLLFRRLAYFTRSLITINIRLCPFLCHGYIFPCSRSIAASRASNWKHQCARQTWFF